MSKLLTLEELADYLKLSKMSIYRMVKKNTIPAIKVANQWRFDKKEIDLWLSEYKKKFVSDTKDEPQQYFNMEHPFVQKYRPIFQEFFNREFEKNPPDYIILLDRKGAKIIEALNIIPEKYAAKIFYPDSFKWMPDHILKNKVKGRAIAIIDEMVQYGNNFRIQRDFFEDKKAAVKTYTLARRKLYFERGKLRDPYVNACLDLDDTSFMRFTAEMSKFFLSQGIPLDVDHILLKIIPKERIRDTEKLLEYFASLGKIYFIPTSYRENEKVIITIDNPIFFNISNVEIPEGLEAEGVCKLRMYLHQRDGYFFLVPIVFPKLRIRPKSFIEKVSTNGHLYSPFCAIDHIKDFSSINPKYQAEYFFRTLSLYLSNLMVSKFIQFMNSTNDYIQITPDTVSINNEDFIRNYGNEVGTYLYELVKKEIYNACIKIKKEVPFHIKPSTIHHTLKIAWSLPELDNEDICDIITNFFFEEKNNKRDDEEKISHGLSFTEIKDKLSDLSEDDISKALDILLDRGVIKPLNEARPNIDNATEYLYLRTYRKGEYDDPLWGPWSEVSLARTDEAFAIEQIIRLIPFTLERLMQSIPNQKDGVISTLANKVFANLQHDWDYEKFGALFLYWKPYRFGPIVGVPKKWEPFGGYHSLSSFADKHKTYFWDDKLKIFKPSYDIDWKKDLNAYLDPWEEDIFMGLIDIYSSIYSKCNDSSTNILITLSACRNERLTYIHCYKNINLWEEAFDIFLCQLKLMLPTLKKDNMALERYLEDIAKPISLMGEKLKRFKELSMTKRILQEKLHTHPRIGIVRAILESIEEPPKITEDITRLENVYFVTKAFNNIVRQLFFQLGLALDTRKSKTDSKTGEIKDTRWYAMEEFLPLLPASIKEEFMVFLKELFQTANHGSLRVETCNAIENIYRKIKSYYINNDEYLPKPAINKMEREEKFKKFLEARSKIIVREEVAIAYLDIQAYGPLSKGISEKFDPTKIEDPPDPQKLRQKWSQSIDEKIQEMRPKGEISYHYTTDSWIFAYKNADNLFGNLCKIMDYAKENNIFLKCVINWGNPNIQKGIPYGDPYIIAYRICEESGVVKGNQIVITQRLKEKIVNSSYIRHLIKLDDVPIKHIEQPVEVYKFEWEKVIGKNE